MAQTRPSRTHSWSSSLYFLWAHFVFVCFLLALAACQAATPTLSPSEESMPTPLPSLPATLNSLIPLPASLTPGQGVFTLTASSYIYVEPGAAEIVAVGQFLSGLLQPATGEALPVSPASGAPAKGNVYLTTVGADPGLGEEGYSLTITSEGVTLVAYRPAGLFYGVQTLRQLLPASSEKTEAPSATSWQLPAVTIRDLPRYEWRGMMLDVARHFFGVADVKHLIDLMAAYKLNRLHLHLSDDQGWRIMIESWPRLATYGGSLQVGGQAGGYYTQADYAEIVAYAQSHYITVVPEIDLPGHTNAALASYAELNCDGQERPLYTDIEVGFSSLCIGKEITFQFVDDVVRELAAITPGAYIHVGGDEAASTPHKDYVQFIERAQQIVQAHGKRMIGWEEIGQARLQAGAIAQHWHNDDARLAAQQGAQVILSPATRTYLDMKYDPSTALGLKWAAYIEVRDAYEWDPQTQVKGLPPEAILGIEAALWSETIQQRAEIEYLVFPRLLGIAEIAWSPAEGRTWEEYALRLAAHSPRLEALGVNFYRSPQVRWP